MKRKGGRLVDTRDIYNFHKSGGRGGGHGSDNDEIDFDNGGDGDDSIDSLIDEIPSSASSSSCYSSCNSQSSVIDHFDALERESQEEKKQRKKGQVEIGRINATISPTITGKQQIILDRPATTAASNTLKSISRPTTTTTTTIPNTTISIPIVTSQGPPKCISLKDAYENERHAYSARLDRQFHKCYIPFTSHETDDEKEEEEEEQSNKLKKKSKSLSIQPRSVKSQLALYDEEEEDDQSEQEKDDDDDEYRRFTSSGRKECFLCAWGDRFHDGVKAPHIEKLEAIIDECYGYYSNEDLAQQVHLYYKEVIYDESRGMEMLEAVDVLRHIEELHSLNAKIYVGEKIRDWRRVETLTMNKIYREDGTIDTKAVIAAERATKVTLSLYKCNIQKLLFNKGVSTDDINRLGRYHNIMPMYSQREEQHRNDHRKRLKVNSSFTTFHG